jgi:hypothetical protein
LREIPILTKIRVARSLEPGGFGLKFQLVRVITDDTDIRLGRVKIHFAYSVEETAAALGTHRNVGDGKALLNPQPDGGKKDRIAAPLITAGRRSANRVLRVLNKSSMS